MKTSPLLDASEVSTAIAWRQTWLLRYVLLVATMAFVGRTMPLTFLPLVLKDQFGQESAVIGAVMAVYPFAALVSTPSMAGLCRRSQKIIRLHSLALLALSSAVLLSSVVSNLQIAAGTRVAMVVLFICRALQGMFASLYLSSNTILITRVFSTKIPYVIGLTEVAVGSGSNIGRIAGGFLYDLGGYPCPFLIVGAIQAVVAYVGWQMFDEQQSRGEEGVAGGEWKPTEKLPWSSLVTPRLLVGAAGVLMVFFGQTAIEVTLPAHIQEYLGPVSMGTLSSAISIRGITYLSSSLVIAKLMHRELVSFESLIICGAVSALLGYSLQAPQPCVLRALERLWSGEALVVAQWVVQLGANVLCQMGSSMLFVPSLPLMQSEVRQHGTRAVEQVAEVFVTMLSLGEMAGAIAGGAATQSLGFTRASCWLAMMYMPILIGMIFLYDKKEIRARAAAAAAMRAASPHAVAQQLPVALDGEAAFAARRIPFALAQPVPHHSAPSTFFGGQPLVEDDDDAPGPGIFARKASH